MSEEAAAALATVEMTATTTYQVLRGCRSCHAPHPLARGLPDGPCPDCGAPSVPPEEPVTIEAVVSEELKQEALSAIQENRNAEL